MTERPPALPVQGAPLPSIAFFSAYYPSHGGGMELASEDLVRRLRGHGLPLSWLAQSTGTLPEGLGEACIPVSGSDIVYRLSGVPLPIPAPWDMPAIVRAAAKSDVVIIAEANFLLSVAAYIAAKLLRRPVLLIQHVGEPSTVSRLARMLMHAGERIATRPMLRKAEGVVCVSSAVARHFDGLRPSRPPEVIGHGIDTEVFRLPASNGERLADRTALGLAAAGKWACFVGRLTESKGASVIREIAKLRPDWNFAVAGTGPVSPRAWGLPNVVPLGYLGREAVARLYRSCDVMVLPSPSESFSLVVREALASGCGVLCSDQMLDVDSSLASFVTVRPVDLGDVAGTAREFAGALDAVSHDAQRARDHVAATCSWNAVLDRYLAAIRSVHSDVRPKC